MVSSETDSTYVQWGWAAEFINDGLVEADHSIPHVGWTSQVKQYIALEDFEEEWIWFDLKSVYKIDKVVLWPRQDQVENFRWTTTLKYPPMTRTLPKLLK